MVDVVFKQTHESGSVTGPSAEQLTDNSLLWLSSTEQGPLYRPNYRESAIRWDPLQKSMSIL